MIKINVVTVTNDNLISILNNPNVFGVKPSGWVTEKYELKPFGECEIGKILSGEIPVIEILKDQEQKAPFLFRVRNTYFNEAINYISE